MTEINESFIQNETREHISKILNVLEDDPGVETRELVKQAVVYLEELCKKADDISRMLSNIEFRIRNK